MTNHSDIEKLEQAVLGAVMLDRNAIHIANQLLTPEQFDSPKHQTTFKAIQSLFDEREAIDIITVSERLKRMGELDQVGGHYFVSQLTNNVASASNVESHCRLLQQHYMVRKWREMAAEIHHETQSGTSDPFDIDEKVTQFQLSLTDIATRGNGVVSIRQMSADVIKRIEVAAELKGMTGTPTGIVELDRMYGGRQDGTLYISAARPAMGKTAKMLCEALAAAQAGKHAVIFSLEMLEIELINRLLSVSSGIDNWKIRYGKLSTFEHQEISKALGVLERLPIHLVCGPKSLREIITLSMRQKQKGECDIIFIDYLQIVDNHIKGGNREQEISQISRRLKALSLDLKVPVNALSQLNRSVETRGGQKRPQLSDLRESGAIEQDADVVEFVHRPEYYGITEYEDGGSTRGLAEIIVAKHRNGAVGTVKSLFIESLTKFTDWKDGAAIQANDGFESETPF